MAVLPELVQRAAVMRLPFSPHDAILLVRALKHLQQHGAAVKRINEKAAFAVAAASPPVDAAVVVDVVHHLAAMQSSSLPIVHQVLLRRVLELHPQHTPPQTAHKSAVTIIKIGFRHRHEEASLHVLRLLHEAMLREEMAMDAADESLRLAFVGLYPYTKLGEGEVLRRECVAPSASSRRASSQRLLMCAEWLTRGSSSSPPPMASMRGSRALQALHLAVPLAACTSATPHDDGDDDDGQRRWSAVLRSFCSHLCLDHIRGSSCTRFIYDFMPQLVLQRRVAAVFLERLAHVPWMCKLGPQDLYRLAASMGQYCDRSAPTAQGWRGSSTQIDDGLKHVVELLQGCVGRLYEVMEQPPAHMPTSSSAITHEEYSLALASMWRWAAQLIHGLHEDHLAHHRAHLRPAIDGLRRCTAAALRQGRCSNDHVPWMVVSICRITHRGMLSSVKDVRENDDDDVAQLVKCTQSKPRTHRGVIQLIYAITLLGQEEHGQRWIQRLHQRHGIDLRECVRQWCAELGGIEAATQLADAMMLLHSILNWEPFFDAATTTTTTSSESSSSPPPALMHAALSAAVAVPSFDETSALIVVEAVACAMHFTTDIHQLEMLASILATAERSIPRGLPFNHMLRIAAQVARVPRSRIHHHLSMELAHQRIVALICTSSAHLRRKPPRKRHRFLAVAEALLHHGVKLVVHPCATHNNGSNTNDDAHADDVFVVDVEWLMRGDGDDAMSERDAAHLLRLLSQAVLLHNHDVVAHLSSDLLHSLMQRAFRASNDANMPWRCVLLLNANDHLNASMALFSNEQLHQICDLTLQTVRDLLPSSSSTATHDDDDDDDDDDANTKLIRQLVVALVQSQIPVRLASVDTWANAAEAASTLSAVADWLRERSSSTSHTSSGGDDMASLAFRLQIIFGLPPPS